MTLQITIPRWLTDKFLRKMVPLVVETVGLFKENADEDGLTAKLKHWIKVYQVDGWAEAYEDFGNFLAVHVAALATLDDKLEGIFNPPTITSLEDLQRWVDALWVECESMLDDDSDDAIEFVLRESPEPFEPVPTNEDGQPISRQGIFLVAALIITFNYFSCMVHRKSLFQLVAEAKAGDDEALLKAIQIDKRCLTEIEYFRERLANAVIAGDTVFLRRIAQYRKKPVFQSGTTLSSFYLVLSLLGSLGMLDDYARDPVRFSHLCRELGVYGPSDDTVDIVDSFDRSLRRFKTEHQALGPKNKIFFVKDRV